ncbi:NUDIX hydrolase [Streptomyces sp. NPDC020412]|uniref:NUDIX hydrolase n=1 Tax=Streptomyces sp. NPDC020412 TaxID=3365073 RepID=UPI00379E1473
MSSDQEWIDVVDAFDTVVGQATRGEAYARGLCHRVTFVLARDERDRIFVHRRTATKKVHPGMYDMFVGGVVGAGETYDDAALREAEEELGVSGLPRPTRLFTFRYEGADGQSWWSTVYEVRCALPVQPQQEEVDWYAFLPEEEVERRLTEWAWAPDSLAAWPRLRRATREAGSARGSGGGEHH